MSFSLLFTGNGGGVAISVPLDPQHSQPCWGPPTFNWTYWPYSHNSAIAMANSTIVNNSATSAISSGGGLWLGSGGVASVSGTTLRGNTAGLFGGGIGAGNGESSDTCALQLLVGTLLEGNVAHHGGGQVSMGCAADFLVEGAAMQLAASGTQVRGSSSLCMLSLLLLLSLGVDTRMCIALYVCGWLGGVVGRSLVG